MSLRLRPSKLVLESGMAKFEVRRSPIHGKGLFATARIRANTKLGTYQGTLTQDNGPHVLWYEDEQGQSVGIDGHNVLRYVNHSKRPNAVFLGPDLFSLVTIHPDTEITFDYGEDWDAEPAADLLELPVEARAAPPPPTLQTQTQTRLRRRG